MNSRQRKALIKKARQRVKDALRDEELARSDHAKEGLRRYETAMRSSNTYAIALSHAQQARAHHQAALASLQLWLDEGLCD